MPPVLSDRAPRLCGWVPPRWLVERLRRAGFDCPAERGGPGSCARPYAHPVGDRVGHGMSVSDPSTGAAWWFELDDHGLRLLDFWGESGTVRGVELVNLIDTPVDAVVDRPGGRPPVLDGVDHPRGRPPVLDADHPLSVAGGELGRAVVVDDYGNVVAVASSPAWAARLVEAANAGVTPLPELPELPQLPDLEGGLDQSDDPLDRLELATRCPWRLPAAVGARLRDGGFTVVSHCSAAHPRGAEHPVQHHLVVSKGPSWQVVVDDTGRPVADADTLRSFHVPSELVAALLPEPPREAAAEAPWYDLAETVAATVATVNHCLAGDHGYALERDARLTPSAHVRCKGLTFPLEVVEQAGPERLAELVAASVRRDVAAGLRGVLEQQDRWTR